MPEGLNVNAYLPTTVLVVRFSGSSCPSLGGLDAVAPDTRGHCESQAPAEVQACGRMSSAVTGWVGGMGLRPVTVLIDPAKKRAFEALCARQDATPSQVVRRLMCDYLVYDGVTTC